MTESEIVVFLLCVVPGLMFLTAVFACELRIQYRENDTRRYPKYGQSPEMRTKGKSRIKNPCKDNET